MNFSQFLLILRARQRVIWITLVIVVAATLAISLLLPKTYKGTASVLLNYKGVDTVTGLAWPATWPRKSISSAARTLPCMSSIL
jgi:succinoglycan biosynthesis transport protein ExoP